jgi:pyruvate formate lyase activating enzyme
MFGGLQKTSLIDFPDRIATVLFTPGCNLRCPFCHNWRLVLEPKGPFLTEKDVLQILESRKRHLKAVVITGGEPCMHDDLPKFAAGLKDAGFAVKLDTNGFFPDVLEKNLPYLDYVALDVKTSLEKYQRLGASEVDTFSRSIDILKQGKVDYEFRTTVVPSFVDEEDIQKIGELAEDAKRFIFQQFIPNDTLDKSFRNIKPYSADVMLNYADTMKNYVHNISLRI